jgi:hypothetical protein
VFACGVVMCFQWVMGSILRCSLMEKTVSGIVLVLFDNILLVQGVG